MQESERGVFVCGGLSRILCTLPKLKKSHCRRGRARQGRNSRAVRLSSTSAGCRIHRPRFQTFFKREGEGGIWLLLYPLPLLPCFHGNEERQDVADSHHLGGWQGRHLVNISPSTSTQHKQLSPGNPQAHCLYHSLPSWSWYHASCTPGMAAGVHVPARSHWQEP